MAMMQQPQHQQGALPQSLDERSFSRRTTREDDDDDNDDNDFSPIEAPAQPSMTSSPSSSVSASSTSTVTSTAPVISTPKVRPPTTRRSTEPGSSEPRQPSLLPTSDTARPTSSHRNRSPFSRSHLRSRSSGSALSIPGNSRVPMQSQLHTSTLGARGSDLAALPPASPLRSPARQRSPFRQEESVAPRSPRWYEGSNALSGIESIQEDSELELTPRSAWSATQSPPVMAPVNNLASRTAAPPRRRPHSPLYMSTTVGSMTSANNTNGTSNTTSANYSSQSSRSSSPSLSVSTPDQPLSWQRQYNESFPPPLLHHSASTSTFSISMPSTPTSQRSRSPSIASLDTIEDAPDLECAALEGERLERLRLAAEREERGETDDDDLAVAGRSPYASYLSSSFSTSFGQSNTRRGSFESGSFSRGGTGFAVRGALNRERKRWSVCGGERRADLDLETIYED